MKPIELQSIIVELYKEGKDLAKIGLILRDKHGIPKAKLLGKKISLILKEAGIYRTNEEKITYEKEIKILQQHTEKNKKDYCAKKSLTKKLWTLNKINSKKKE